MYLKTELERQRIQHALLFMNGDREPVSKWEHSSAASTLFMGICLFFFLHLNLENFVAHINSTGRLYGQVCFPGNSANG
jgi:hypothetical protein